MADFPYTKASIVIAHAKLFSKRKACDIYNVKSSTYDQWRNRLNSDEKLQQMCDHELKKLANQWQGETVTALKKGLQVANMAFDNHPFRLPPKTNRDIEAWAKAADSMSKLIKNIGDLAISTTVLNEEDGDDD